jgi:FlaA1/EpsC-like NDP-sugar epimerase
VTFASLPRWLRGRDRRTKQAFVFLVDCASAFLSVWIAFGVRLDDWLRFDSARTTVLLLVLATAVPLFIKFGLYRSIFRYTGLAALATVGKACLLHGAILLTLLVWLAPPNVPRLIGVIQPIVFLMLIVSSRLVARFILKERSSADHPSGHLLIYGAGDSGAQIAAALSRTRQFEIAGYVDDNHSKVGKTLNGKPIFAPELLATTVRELGITDVLLAIPAATRSRRREIVESLHALHVHVRTVPDIRDLASGRANANDASELDIEDLLGREAVQADPNLLARLQLGKTVLVTGAGGSIGSELCRQVLLQQPRLLVLLDSSEFALYGIDHELRIVQNEIAPTTQVISLLGSVTNGLRINDIMQTHRPDTVYHAAAYKHVPLVEGNPLEGVENNVMGTLTCALAARAAGVSSFVLVSTDKAVRPTNVMGATKRMAEMVLQAFDFDDSKDTNSPSGRTVFSMVRFGNVLGSSGSVVPLFRRQIAQGGPITLTHLEVTRYFMTIPEAAQLVLQAGAMAIGGDVFLLDMGEPVKIIDLARRMAQLAGTSLIVPGESGAGISVEVTGLRPGEKLFEELLVSGTPVPTEHPRILRATEEMLPLPELQRALSKLSDAIATRNAAQAISVLEGTIKGFQPSRP